jgi:nucleoside-diphosphate-sugar epimerase
MQEIKQMTKTALILGSSGKIGRHSLQAFAGAGWQVRAYDRKRGDMVSAARGADVIVNGLNPPNYHDWARIIPAVTAQVIEAAKASGATVMIPGNVYNLSPEVSEWSEHTPHTPTTKKGRIREEMEQAYRAAGVRTIVLRAGNFIDPERNGDVMSLVLLRDLARGKVTAPGDVNAMQAYCYLPDWARAAVALAEIKDQLAPFEDIPFPGHNFTLEQLRTFLSARLGRPLGIARFPWWVMTLASPFWELARELREMRYLWDLSCTLSAEKCSRILPDFRATPLSEVLLPAQAQPT